MAKSILNTIFDFDNKLTGILIIPIILLFIFMYFNPNNSFTKSYEATVNQRRQARKEFWNSLGIHPEVK